MSEIFLSTGERSRDYGEQKSTSLWAPVLTSDTCHHRYQCAQHKQRSTSLSLEVQEAQRKFWSGSHWIPSRRVHRLHPVSTICGFSGMSITDSGTVWLHRGYVREPVSTYYVAFLLLVLIRSGLERADGCSCANSAEGGFLRFVQRCSINLLWPRFVLNFIGLLRDGKPTHRYRWCQLAPLRLVRIFQAHHIAVSTAVAEGDRSSWCHGRNF